MNSDSLPPANLEAVTTPLPQRSTASTFQLTRFVLLRLMGVVYLTGFLIAAHQIIPLIGHDGLTPADRVMMPNLQRYYESLGENARDEVPSIFWWDVSDSFVQKMAWVGVALSALVVCGFANTFLMLALWALYMSFVHIGGFWYGYGWEIQTLETGFLAAFLCPLFDPRPFPRSPPAIVVLWLFRWLIFRIMLGAGLIKWRGEESWKDLTALYYHYETQPLPSPVSRVLHFMPHWFHQFGVIWNFFIELVVPWFAFWPLLAGLVLLVPWHRWMPYLRLPARYRIRPQTVCNVAGLLLASFQVILICSGNLAFLNWLTLVPCIACIDDSMWRRIFPSFLVRWSERNHREREFLPHSILSCLLGGLVIVLSYEPVKNLLSKDQVMNNSYDTLALVNTYGAFGSVGQERNEIVFEGMEDPATTKTADWREYEFKAKPGDPMRRPPIITPYYYRIDWQVWFAALQGPNHPNSVWVYPFIWKLLHNDPGTLSLLANNPFPNKPPRYIRAVFYHYKFAPLGNREGAWWTRERLGLWLPSMFSVDTPGFKDFLVQNGFIDPELKK